METWLLWETTANHHHRRRHRVYLFYLSKKMTITKQAERDNSKKCIAVRGNRLTATGNHMQYGIAQCYLPPSRGDFHEFTPAEAGTRFSNPGGMQGWLT